jgi:uncharacterized protein YbjT (DUF2867 family)
MDRLRLTGLGGGMNDILILGGTGKTGGRIAQRLREAGHRVRSASRTRGDVRFELGAPSTWPLALDGIAAVYVMEPEMQVTEEGQRRIPRFADAAAAAGVQRLVLLSAPGVEDNETHPLWRAEEAIKSSGLQWTIVRPTWFAQNFSEAFWLPGILDGSLVLPTGDGATAFVDADDIADVAAAALTHDGHDGEIYVLTGPRAISFGEAVDLIAGATGRTIRHVDISAEAFTQAQIADGVPAHIAEQLTSIYIAIRDGEPAAVFDGVQRALGRQPRAFEEYVSAAAAAGAWRRRPLV